MKAPPPEPHWIRLSDVEVHDLGMSSDFVGHAYRDPVRNITMVTCLNFWMERKPIPVQNPFLTPTPTIPHTPDALPL